MESFKEFQGKNLDIAIQDACSYFNVPREKLEIEIINDSKSGIFGIVGAKKATIRAKKISLSNNLGNILTGSTSKKENVRETVKNNARKQADGQSTLNVSTPNTPDGHEANSEKKNSFDNDNVSIKDTQVLSEAKVKNSDDETSIDDCLSDFSSAEQENGNQPDLLENIDRDQVIKLTRETITTIINNILQTDIEIDVTVLPGRVQVAFDCGQDSGIIIGRDGQTLVSIQYIASRIVSKALNANVRIIIDVGEYRHRQIEKLQEMAISLAERVKSTGKSFSTRPLSSYHRRIVHLCLQDNHEVQTRSIGEGPMKRVIIMRKR